MCESVLAMAATSIWTDRETLKLIELWGDETVQALLKGSTRNRHVYDKISREMGEAGYQRTWSQSLRCNEF